MVLVLSEVYSRLRYDAVETTNHTSGFIINSIWTGDINFVSHLRARIQGDPIATKHQTLQQAHLTLD